MSVTQGGRTDFNGTVSVNNFASASASACLDLTSTTQGALLPRMNTTQQNNISTPATGLTIYNTSNNLLSTYNGSAWTQSGSTLISSQILSGAVATVTFSSIPGTFNHLKLVVKCRASDAAGNVSVFMRMNGDSGANYDWQQLSGANATPSATANAAQTGMFVGYCTATTAAASTAGILEINIPCYTDTLFFKNASSFAGLIASSTGNTVTTIFENQYRSTSAVTSVTFYTSSGSNFITGSLFYLYGIL
jgi:hypothetical protein